MITASNTDVWPNGSGRPEGVPTIEDIGQGLGRIPRFAGQIHEWYPVLAHVLTVAAILPEQYGIYGLLHDAPEAIMNDTPTPWKSREQKKLEHTLYERIARYYGVVWPIPKHIQTLIDHADYDCLIAEGFLLGHPNMEALAYRDPTAAPREDVIEITRANYAAARRVIRRERDPVTGRPGTTHAFLDSATAAAAYRGAFEHYMRVFDPAPLEVEVASG